MDKQKEKTVNQIIFEWMHPDKCWHEYAPDRTAWIRKRTFLGLTSFVSNPDANLCVKCGKDAGTPLKVNDEPLVSTALKVPAYDEDLNAVAKVEAKVIETFGRKEYHDAILDVIIETWPGYELPMDVAFAGAKERSQAIVALIQEQI